MKKKISAILLSLFCTVSALEANELTRVMLDILDTEHVCDVATTNTSLSCHVVLPYKQDMSATFCNLEMCELMADHGLDHNRQLPTLHKRYTAAVAIISNNGPQSVFVVKDSYLLNNETQCACVITPRGKFLQHYPDLGDLKGELQEQGWWLIGPGIAGMSLGALMGVVGGIGHFKAGTGKRWPGVTMATGGIFGLTGLALILCGYGHHVETITPIDKIKSHRKRLELYLQPKIVPGIVMLDTDIPSLIQLLLVPSKYRAHKNVYEIGPNETLLEVVIIKKSNVAAMKNLSLQHFVKNPHLVHAIHPSIHQHAHVQAP